MNPESKPLVGTDTSGGNHKTFPYLLIAGVFAVCILGLCAWAFFPGFVTLPIELPKDDYASGIWDTTSYSVLYQDLGRVFTWRKYATVVYERADSSNKLAVIEDYFLVEIAKRGLTVSETPEICNGYLPEARLLVEQQEGSMLQFQQKGHPIYDTGDYFGDLVCVSILEVHRNTTKPDQVFDITLLTARQSPLKILLDYWGTL